MIASLPASVRVYLCAAPCDLRKSFDGLHQLVREAMGLDAFAGHLYVFANKRKDRLKVIYWDRDGFAIWYKRLEEGSYAMPFGEQREISGAELNAILSGIDLAKAERRKRYERTRAATA